MILKYKVPKKERFRYNNKRTLYCKIEQKQPILTTDKICYKVKMLNYHNLTNIFMNYELKKLNILDKLKLIFV